MTQSRVPRGVSTGGRFTSAGRPESAPLDGPGTFTDRELYVALSSFRFGLSLKGNKALLDAYRDAGWTPELLRQARAAGLYEWSLGSLDFTQRNPDAVDRITALEGAPALRLGQDAVKRAIERANPDDIRAAVASWREHLDDDRFQADLLFAGHQDRENAPDADRFLALIRGGVSDSALDDRTLDKYPVEDVVAAHQVESESWKVGNLLRKGWTASDVEKYGKGVVRMWADHHDELLSSNLTPQDARTWARVAGPKFTPALAAEMQAAGVTPEEAKARRQANPKWSGAQVASSLMHVPVPEHVAKKVSPEVLTRVAANPRLLSAVDAAWTPYRGIPDEDVEHLERLVADDTVDPKSIGPASRAGIPISEIRPDHFETPMRMWNAGAEHREAFNVPHRDEWIRRGRKGARLVWPWTADDFAEEA